MPDRTHHTTSPTILQPETLSQEQWEQEVLARLPEGWQQQAKDLKAFRRSRQLRTAADVLRGLLAYVLCVRSFRHLGCWSVLIELADISEAAWRKRMRQARRWLGWLLIEMLAISACTSPWLLGKGVRRVLLVDGTHLRCLGKQGEVWRVHTAFDLCAGRLTQVHVTDNKVAEQWELFDVQEGDLVVSDSANGYQDRLLFILERKADALVRFWPATLPLWDDEGKRIDLVRWLKGRHAPAGRVCERRVWLSGEEGKREVRVVALRLTDAQTQAARKRKRKKAGQNKRKLQADTLYLAGWLLVVTTLPSTQWSPAEVLALYRSRWHIELFFKRFKQLLDAHRVRCEHPESAQANILALLLAWTLQEDELVAARMQLQQAASLPVEVPAVMVMPEPEQGQEQASSEWLLAALSLDVLREQVRGRITAARLRACLPRLHRFVRGSPRKRTHWYSQCCRWLLAPSA
jgi:hypothetical protein